MPSTRENANYKNLLQVILELINSKKSRNQLLKSSFCVIGCQFWQSAIQLAINMRNAHAH